MSSEFDVDEDNQPEIPSDIPVYSEINIKRESSPPHVETFVNQAYSINTLVNTHTTVEQANPATPSYDNVLGTKTAPHKEKSKKDQCERNLVWIVISVIILLLLAVGAVSVAALVQVSKLNPKMVSNNQSLPLAEVSKLNDKIASLSNSSAMLNQNFSALDNKIRNIFEQFESRVSDLYALHLIGRNSDNSAISCSHVLQLNSSSPSGHYWIRSSNGSAVHVYCDMTRSCGGVTGGWMRVASLDMRDNSSQCPIGLRLGTPRNCTPELRICEIGTNSQTGKCSSNNYTSHGLQYSQVCGMIRAYQYRTPNAFTSKTQVYINSNYVDGVSLTHGVPPLRKHIWTFAAGK